MQSAVKRQTRLRLQQINLVIYGKGGIGKSFFATHLVQYLKDGCLAHRALDTDHENSTLKRLHPEAEFVSLEDKRGLDPVFLAAETSSLLVIDFHAASADLFLDYFAEVVLSEVLSLFDARLTITVRSITRRLRGAGAPLVRRLGA